MATKITNNLFVTYNLEYDYSGNLYTDHFGTKYSSATNFTLECWFYPKIVSSNLIPIFFVYL